MDLRVEKEGNVLIIYLPDNIDMIMSSSLEKRINQIFSEESECDYIIESRECAYHQQFRTENFHYSQKKAQGRRQGGCSLFNT